MELLLRARGALRQVMQLDAPAGAEIIRAMATGKPSALRKEAAQAFVDAAATAWLKQNKAYELPTTEATSLLAIAQAIAKNCLWDAGLHLRTRSLTGYCPICSPGWLPFWSAVGFDTADPTFLSNLKQDRSVADRCMNRQYFEEHFTNQDDHLHAGFHAFLTTCHPATTPK